jgi:hypothetical protein
VRFEPRLQQVPVHARAGRRGGHPSLQRNRARIERVVERLLLHERHDVHRPAVVRPAIAAAIDITGGKGLVGVVVVVQRQPELLHVVVALGAARRFPRGLDRGKQESHQDPDDGNHHQEFDEREAALPARRRRCFCAHYVRSSKRRDRNGRGKMRVCAQNALHRCEQKRKRQAGGGRGLPGGEMPWGLILCGTPNRSRHAATRT